MQIKLENIGIVKNSSIELNGLTVITGKNNSGKSTVGKTLYALLDAVSNISEKYEIDRYNYMVKILEENQSMMSVFRLIKYGQMMEDSPTDDDILRKYSYLKKYINKDYKRKTNSNSISSHAMRTISTHSLSFYSFACRPSIQIKELTIFLAFVSAQPQPF